MPQGHQDLTPISIREVGTREVLDSQSGPWRVMAPAAAGSVSRCGGQDLGEPCLDLGAACRELIVVGTRSGPNILQHCPKHVVLAHDVPFYDPGLGGTDMRWRSALSTKMLAAEDQSVAVTQPRAGGRQRRRARRSVVGD